MAGGLLHASPIGIKRPHAASATYYAPTNQMALHYVAQCAHKNETLVLWRLEKSALHVGWEATFHPQYRAVTVAVFFE